MRVFSGKIARDVLALTGYPKSLAADGAVEPTRNAGLWFK